MGSMISGILGGGQSPGQQAQMQGIQASREDIQRYRPEAMQAALNAFAQASSAYQPMNNMLETMYGGGGGAKPPPDFRNFKPMPRTAPPQGAAPPAQPGRPQGRPDPYNNNVGLQLLDPAGIFKEFWR